MGSFGKYSRKPGTAAEKEMNIYFWILILFYASGLGFLLGVYYADSVERWERTYDCSPFEKILCFLVSPAMATIWLFIWIKKEFFRIK